MFKPVGPIDNDTRGRCWEPGTQERVINKREAVNQRIKNACSWDETVIRLPFNRMLVVGVEGEALHETGDAQKVWYVRPSLFHEATDANPQPHGLAMFEDYTG